MKITEAKIENLEILTEMNIELRNDEKMDNFMSQSEVRERMCKFINNKEYKIFLCELNANIIGYALLNIAASPMYLRQLFVIKKYRNNGFGKAIINSIMEKMSIIEIDLEVMSWNESAIEFYKNFGFKSRYIGMRYSNK